MTKALKLNGKQESQYYHLEIKIIIVFWNLKRNFFLYKLR